MTEIKQKLSEYISGKFELDTDMIYSSLAYPPDKKMGDLSLPCFKFAKQLRRAPAAIAEMLAKDFDCPGIDRAECVDGYLNFFVSDSYFSDTLLDTILKSGENYGASRDGEGRTIVLDYSSPNVAKPFHLGHLGTTVIGHSLKLLFEFCGYTCVGINHLGDWGTSMGKQIAAYKLWGSREMIEEKGVDGLVELYVKFHEVAEKDEALFDIARAESARLENGDAENRELWKWFIDISILEYRKTYAQLGIEFDHYIGESFFTDKMPAQVELMREKGLLKVDNGASIVDLSEYNMPPCLILKRDGSTLYPARDIAAAVYRHDRFDFERALYVTSAGQSLHFAQWFKTVELMGYEWAKNLIHVPYGTMSFGGSKLGTRGGNSIWLKQLIGMSIEKVREIMAKKNPNMKNPEAAAEAVGVGAIVYYYLSNNRIKDIEFQFEDALNFDGNTGPYVQYTYARICGMLKKAQSAGLFPVIEDENRAAHQITSPHERELLSVMALFPEKIKAAAADYEPSVITRYIYELASAFNRFYNECPVLTEDHGASVTEFRLRLTQAAKYVLGRALTLICMKKTEEI